MKGKVFILKKATPKIPIKEKRLKTKPIDTKNLNLRDEDKRSRIKPEINKVVKVAVITSPIEKIM